MRCRSARWLCATMRATTSPRRTTRRYTGTTRPRMQTDRLSGVTLYVTLEPCAQCAGAIILAKVERVVFGAWDQRAGMAGSVMDLLRDPRLNHRPEVVGGVLSEECGEMLRQFVRARRGGGWDGPSTGTTGNHPTV